MMRRLVVPSVALISATTAFAETGVIEMSYLCDRNVALHVSFINPTDGPGLAVMHVEGKLVTLRSLPTGSGVRYVAFDEQDSYRLYTKGDEAFVAWMAADHTASEVTVLDGCRAGG